MTSYGNILCLDTATERTVVSLGRRSDEGLRLLGVAEVDAPRAAMSRVLLLVESVLAEAHLDISDVNAVVAGRGPGSFTGVRIGVATAKGLAHGLGTKLFGVSTLEAIAWHFADLAERRLVGVVGDAMRGEVYPVLFECGEGSVRRLGDDRVSAPREAAQQWSEHGSDIILTGNGLAKHGAVFSEVLGSPTITEEPTWRPGGRELLRAFAAAAHAGTLGDGRPEGLLPVYTRLSDAEENERARSGAGKAAIPDNGVGGAP